MPKIFLSYRRSDSEDIAGRIYDRLVAHFGKGSLFFDVDTIPFGTDFREFLQGGVQQCQVLVAIIGPTWLSTIDDDGHRRLDNTADWVRIELESALARDIPVIPLLVRGARLPKATELPASLQALAYRNAATARAGRDFHRDMDVLIRGIETLIERFLATPSSTPHTPVEWASPTTPSAAPAPSTPSQNPARTPPAVPQSYRSERVESYPTFEFETATITGIEKTGLLGLGQPKLTITRRRTQAEYFREALGNGSTLDLVQIPAGQFLMGSPDSEEGRLDREGPQHRVSVPEFWLGKYPVTQAQYQAIMGQNPSRFSENGANRPVERVFWHDAVAFCEKLSQQTGRTYRLPSEAEWEYACRAGTTTPFYFGETISPVLANYGYSNLGQTTDVGQFPPNTFGLYDMHGNVLEWCADHWHDNYNGAHVDGSAWLVPGESENRHILRGGSWYSKPGVCRSANRGSGAPDIIGFDIGFRVVCGGTKT